MVSNRLDGKGRELNCDMVHWDALGIVLIAFRKRYVILKNLVKDLN